MRSMSADPDTGLGAGGGAGRIAPNLFGSVRTFMRVEQAGIQTPIQDVPGRVGTGRSRTAVGLMDDLGLRLANESVGNPEQAAGIEITLGGFAAVFGRETIIALGGAPTTATCDDVDIPWLSPYTVPAGGRVVVPTPRSGMRTYLAVRGGFDTASYLGSRATFTLGGFGGHQGRALADGDRLLTTAHADRHAAFRSSGVRPSAPHGTSVSASVRIPVPTVHRRPGRYFPQSNRTGIRLDGPTPRWARTDGGEAGRILNLHDNAYAFGAIDLTGDLPVLDPMVRVSILRLSGHRGLWAALEAGATAPRRPGPLAHPRCGRGKLCTGVQIAAGCLPSMPPIIRQLPCAGPPGSLSAPAGRRVPPARFGPMGRTDCVCACNRSTSACAAAIPGASTSSWDPFTTVPSIRQRRRRPSR